MVPYTCDGPCKRRLMIWDTECYPDPKSNRSRWCDECIAEDRLLHDRGIRIVEVLPEAEAPEGPYDPGFTDTEEGSKERFDLRRRQVPWRTHTLSWVLHNCVAHFLIGVLPLTPFFKFHDWTSRKMHGRS